MRRGHVTGQKRERPGAADWYAQIDTANIARVESALTNFEKRSRKMKRVARIFEESSGKYHVCDDALSYLDARGAAYNNKREALEGAYRSGYTHAVGSGTYKSGATIRSQCPAAARWQAEHERAQQDSED